MQSEITKVLIAIQARTGSSRYPGKVLEKIGHKTVLDFMLGAAGDSSYFLMDMFRRRTFCASSLDVKTCLLIPEGDKIKDLYAGKVDIIEGDEKDVLSRYVKAARSYNADYIVRLTADCPLIPPFVISAHVKQAIKIRADYVQNVDPLTRTSPDGWDCEVISSRALNFLSEMSRTKDQREHVTLLLRQNPPPWAIIWHCIGYKDDSSYKISFDTEEDKKEIEKQFEAVSKKISIAKKLGHGVFRL